MKIVYFSGKSSSGRRPREKCARHQNGSIYPPLPFLFFCFFVSFDTNVATGGRKYQAAAQGVQQEVEEIRGELVKLLKTLNSTRVDIIGAENELQKKVNVSVVFVPFDSHDTAWHAMRRHATCHLMP